MGGGDHQGSFIIFYNVEEHQKIYENTFLSNNQCNNEIYSIIRNVRQLRTVEKRDNYM